MNSFVTRFLGLWLAAMLVGLAWPAVTFRLVRDLNAEHSYIKIPVIAIVGYGAIAALALATMLPALMRRLRRGA